MATISHEPVTSEKRSWTQFLVPEMWASLAICTIWLAVLFDSIYGPDIVSHSAGGDGAVVPSSVVLAFFAFFATWVVAKYGFRRDKSS
jgi:hypothetical protein